MLVKTFQPGSLNPAWSENRSTQIIKIPEKQGKRNLDGKSQNPGTPPERWRAGKFHKLHFAPLRRGVSMANILWVLI
jgi:hypothetical protein